MAKSQELGLDAQSTRYHLTTTLSTVDEYIYRSHVMIHLTTRLSNETMTQSDETHVYYLPGSGGKLNTGLGTVIHDLGYEVVGRETRGTFNQLSFQEKIDRISKDLQTHFWRESACVIANSFGAYLFLHAQLQLEPYPGRVLCLSPIIGDFADAHSMKGFIPPRSTEILKRANSGRMPRPREIEIHVGDKDWQSNPERVSELGSLLQIETHVIPDTGHQLNHSYVRDLLASWLPE